MDVGISKRKKGITWRCEKGQENRGKGGYIGESANILEKVSRTPSHRVSFKNPSFIQALSPQKSNPILRDRAKSNCNHTAARSLQCQIFNCNNRSSFFIKSQILTAPGRPFKKLKLQLQCSSLKRTRRSSTTMGRAGRDWL